LALDRDVPKEKRDESARIYVYERLPHHLAPWVLPPGEFRTRCRRFGLLVILLAAVSYWLAKHNAKPTTDDRAPQPQADSRVIRFATMALIVNCIGLALELLLDDQRLLGARVLRFYWFRMADAVVPLAVAIGVGGWIFELWRRSRRRGQAVVAVALLLCSAHMLRIAADRWQHPAPPGVARMGDVDAWLAACEWIRQHAAPDAACLIPRYAQSFKWYAQRADVVNWKDVPQDARGVIEWQRRIRDVFPTIETPEGPLILSSPEQWGARRALDVAHRYGAEYIIARSEPPLGLNEVFAARSGEGPGYAIYHVDAVGSFEPPGNVR
jgi:hypothetical protein